MHQISGGLWQRQQSNLHKVYKLKTVDFLAFHMLPIDFDMKEENKADKLNIQQDKITLKDACCIHYDMDVDVVQHFCGGWWMGEHHQSIQILHKLTIYYQITSSSPLQQLLLIVCPIVCTEKLA